jgi:hypothetical protein
LSCGQFGGHAARRDARDQKRRRRELMSISAHRFAPAQDAATRSGGPVSAPARILAAAVAAALSFAPQARAENWAPFFMGPDDVAVFVDRDSVRRSEGHVQVMAELQFGAGAMDMPLMDRGVTRIVAKVDLGCGGQLVQTVSRSYFDKAGAPVLILDSPQMPARAEPGSFEEQLIKTYCRTLP